LITMLTVVVLVVLPAVPVNVSEKVPVVAVVGGAVAALWHEESDNPSAAISRTPIAYRWKIPSFRFRSVSTIRAVRRASPVSHPPRT